MANLTSAGETYVLTLLQGGYSASYTEGFDRIGIYGSIASAADSLIDSVQSITWGWTAGNTSIYILTPSSLIFSVAADTVVKGVFLFNSTEGITYGDELSQYILESPRSFTNAGTVEIASLTYNFDRI
jgi:hypothetical protein